MSRVQVRRGASDEASSLNGADPTVSLLLRRAEYAVRQQLQPTLDLEDLLFEHWQIIAVLRTRSPMRMSDVADAAVLPPATVTRHVDKLVERALVLRRIAPEDKRSVVAGLSDLGVSLADHLGRLEQEALRSLEPRAERHHLVSLLAEFTRGG